MFEGGTSGIFRFVVKSSIAGCLYTDRHCLSIICLRHSHNFPFLNNKTCCLRTLLWQKPVFTISSCTTHKANMTAMFAKKRGGHYLPYDRFWTCWCVRRLGRWAVWEAQRLAASYTRTSTDSDSTLLSAHLRISSDQNRLGLDSFSLINPQQSV